jgi:hypothetical protein
VVAVTGTPQLYVADEGGVVHFAGDPRALDGRFVDWSDRAEVTLDQIQTLPRGEPWLTTALVKIGSAIYLPQWQAGATTPALLQIGTPEDLALLGVNADNYGRLVLDSAAWEQRYNTSLDQLTYADFDLAGTPAVGPAAPEFVSEGAPSESSPAAPDSAPVATES